MAINLFDFSKNQSTLPDARNYLSQFKPTAQMSGGFNSISSTWNVPTARITPKPVFWSDVQKWRWATNLFSDEQEAFNKMLQDGIDEIKAKEVITQRRQSMLWSLNPKESQALQKMMADGLDSKTAVDVVKEQRKYEEQKWAKENPVKNVGRWLFNVPVWAASLVAEQTWNVLDFATMWKAWFWEDVERIKQANQYLEWSVWAKTGRVITWIGETLAVWPTRLAPTLLWRTAQWAAVWGITWAAMPVLEQGSDATMWDIAMWWVVWWTIWAVATPVLEKVAIPAVVWTLQKGKKYWTALIKGWAEWLWKSVWRDVKVLWQTLKKWTTIPVTQTTTRTIPTKIVERDLWFTPPERDNIVKITGKTPAQYVLDKNLAWKSKTELAQYFEKQANDMYNWIWQQLKNIDVKVKSNAATDALNDMLEQLTSKPKYARAYANDIASIQNMLNRWEYTLDELNNIRRAYDKVNTWIYTAKWEIRSWLDNEIDAKVRRWINDVLQKEALKYGVDVKAMNQDLRAWIQLKDALLRRLSQEERNDFIWLQDLWVSAILSGWNPITAVATIWAKKYGEELAPSIAQKLYNLNKQNVPSRMSRGNTVISNTKSSSLGLTPSTVSNMSKQERLSKPLIKSPLSERERKLLKAPVKTQLETTLKWATTSNIDEVTQSVAKTLKTTKTAEIKAIIQRYLKEFWKDFKNKIWEMIEEIAEKIWAKLNLISDKQGIWVEKTALLKGSDDLIEEANDIITLPVKENKFLTNFAKWKTFDEFISSIRWSSTQYWQYEPRLRTFLRPWAKRLWDLLPNDRRKFITVYRWIDKSENPRIKTQIRSWDFVTTSYDDALWYADSPLNVASIDVPLSKLITEYPEDFLKNNKGKSYDKIEDYELIYKPVIEDFYGITDKQLKQIYEQAQKSKPLKKSN